jgi:predicted RNA binding protein YcfA (HicA-like mRNA interferase family)
MNKLPRNIKPNKLVKYLESNGFVEVGRKGSHVRLKHVDGRWTQVAIHAKPVPVGTLKSIVRQAGLSVEDIFSI